MNGLMLLSVSLTFLALTPLSAEQSGTDTPPFDTPKALEEITPSFETIDAEAPSQAAAPTKEIALAVKEDFFILTNLSNEEDQEDEDDLAAPEFLNAAIILTAPKEESAQPTAAAIREEVPPLAQKLMLKTEEKISADPVASPQTQSFTHTPTARVEASSSQAQINMSEVFKGAPFIYTALLVISVATFALWLYTLMNMRTEKLMPHQMVAALQENLNVGKVDAALLICQSDPSLLGRMMSSGLIARPTNQSEMLQTMQSEGKRASGGFWQKLGLLNDVAIVAPMIGLLGTVVGMFYAFYDINRSVESMNSLFDGLGISVGTTVAGLVLAIVALVLHSTSKYRLAKQLARVESTAISLASKVYRPASKQGEYL